jgi:hypothetical protein
MTRRARSAVITAAVLGGVVALGFAAELVRSGFVRDDASASYVTLPLAALLGALVVGTSVILVRPRSPVGWLLAAGATGSALGVWRFSTHPWPAVIGLVAFYASILLPLHAALVQGLGIGRAAARMMIGAEVFVALLGVTLAVTAPAGAIDRWFIAADQQRHVPNHLVLYSSPGVAHAAQAEWWTVVLLAGLIGTASRVSRWRRMPRHISQFDTPVVLGAIAWVVLMTLSGFAMFVRRVPGARLAIADYGAVILPSLMLGLVAGAIGWAELVAPRIRRRGGSVEIGDVDRAGLQTLLADLLASPAVEVAYADREGWIDASGVRIDIDNDRRHHTIININGAAVAVVLHERDVPVDAVQLAANITAALFEAERATALARARAEAVRAATAEVVRAGDKAAIAVTSDLLSGPVPELVNLANDVRADETSAAAAAESLRAVTARVRELSHGLLPRSLEDDGLQIALGERAAVKGRLPEAIEVTLYLLAYDDPAATIRVEDNTVVVRRSRPPGAEGAARTAALGGTIQGTVATVPVI